MQVGWCHLDLFAGVLPLPVGLSQVLKLGVPSVLMFVAQWMLCSSSSGSGSSSGTCASNPGVLLLLLLLGL